MGRLTGQYVEKVKSILIGLEEPSMEDLQHSLDTSFRDQRHAIIAYKIFICHNHCREQIIRLILQIWNMDKLAIQDGAHGMALGGPRK